MFNVTLHHLAPDLKRAGVEFPEGELAQVSEKRLRELIGALARLAKQDHGPATPELRIAAPHGRFVIQASAGRLRFNSWTVRVGGADLTPDQICAIVTGTDNPVEAARAADEFMLTGRRAGRKKIALVVALILGTNATTAWMLLRPPPPNPFIPDYRPLETGPAERLLTSAAGEYATGAGVGQHGLQLRADGHLHMVIYGPQGSIAEQTDLTAQAAQTSNNPALHLSDGTLIEVLDQNTLRLFGITYRRKGV